jgi:hypothetical protein
MFLVESRKGFSSGQARGALQALNDGARSYAYDSANRLVNVDDLVNYNYNGLGDRLSHDMVGAGLTQYALDLNPSASLRAGAGLTQVLDDGTNTYVYSLGRIAQLSESPTEYFMGDALGSAVRAS